MAMVPAGTTPGAVAVTPDGKQVYVTNAVKQQCLGDRHGHQHGGGHGPGGESTLSVGIVPPPPGVPFLAFSATALDIDFDGSGLPSLTFIPNLP